jgi:uncharacterized protein (DUF433 family)
LKTILDDPDFPAITYKLDTENQPVPIIRSRGIRVQTIVIAVDHWKESEEEVARQYDLPVMVVKEARSFYQAHKATIDALINENNAVEGAHG